LPVFRFTIRELVLATALVACVLSWVVNQSQVVVRYYVTKSAVAHYERRIKELEDENRVQRYWIQKLERDLANRPEPFLDPAAAEKFFK
jgi:di/tricarboxylate transporter